MQWQALVLPPPNISILRPVAKNWSWLQARSLSRARDCWTVSSLLAKNALEQSHGHHGPRLQDMQPVALWLPIPSWREILASRTSASATSESFTVDVPCHNVGGFGWTMCTRREFGSFGTRNICYVFGRRYRITDSLRIDDLNSTSTAYQYRSYSNKQSRSSHVSTTYAPKMRWAAAAANPFGFESGATFAPATLWLGSEWLGAEWLGWEACATSAPVCSARL